VRHINKVNDSMLGPPTVLFLRREGQSPDQSEPLQMSKPSLHRRSAALPDPSEKGIREANSLRLTGKEEFNEITSVLPDPTWKMLGEGIEVGAVALGISHSPSLEKVLETRLEPGICMKKQKMQKKDFTGQLIAYIIFIQAKLPG